MACLFLDVLPAELRNEIYDLVFSSPPRKEVDLLKAPAPPKALLVTCRQIYREARMIHQGAYRAFWSRSEFILAPAKEICSDRGQWQELWRALKALRSEDMDHITAITVVSPVNPQGYSLHGGVSGVPQCDFMSTMMNVLMRTENASEFLDSDDVHIFGLDRHYSFGLATNDEGERRLRSFKSVSEHSLSTKTEVLVQTKLLASDFHDWNTESAASDVDE